MSTISQLKYGVQLRSPHADLINLPHRHWLISPYLEQPNLEGSVWVQLLNLSGALSDNQALLLCQETGGYWLAWVPDYGEMLLHRSQFQ